MRYIQLILFLITLYNVTAEITIGYKRTNISKADVEKIEVSSTSPCPDNSSSKIPSYITDGDKSYTACEYQYLCHDNDQCLLLNTTISSSSNIYHLPSSTTLNANSTDLYNNSTKVHGYYSYNVDKADEKLILLSCSEIQLKDGLCSTEECQADSDCYSNKCVNKVCMVNKDQKSYLCKNNKEKDKLMVKCSLAYQETCNTNEDCGDNAMCSIDKVCVSNPTTKKENYTGKYILTGIGILIVLVGLMALNYFVKSKKRQDEDLGMRYHL